MWVKLSVLTVQKTVQIFCEVWVKLSILTIQKTVQILCEVWVKFSILTVQEFYKFCVKCEWSCQYWQFRKLYKFCVKCEWSCLSVLTVQKTACFLYKFWCSFQTVLLQVHFAGIVTLHTWGKERFFCVNWGYSEHVVLTVSMGKQSHF